MPRDIEEAIEHTLKVPPLPDSELLFLLQVIRAQRGQAETRIGVILSCLSGWYVKNNQDQFRRVLLGTREQ